MKSTFIVIMVFVSCMGYSQTDTEVGNLSHPFQVVYVEDASYIARQQEISRFDFTNKYGLIRNKGKLVLLHYTGYLFEFDGGLIDVREISESLDSEGSYVRPPISDFSKGEVNLWKPEKQHHQIKLVYPWKHTIQLSKHERLPLQWYYDGEKSLSRKPEYEITVKDLHDKVLLQETTKESYFEIDLDKLSLPENLIVCHIGLPEIDEVSDDIVIAFEQEHQVQSSLPKHYSITKYQSFIDGLIALQQEEMDLATRLFHIAIDTHESQEFENMYKNLLDDYPKLKLALE